MLRNATLFWIILFVCGPLQAAGVALALRTEVEVTGGVYRLADIAELTGDSLFSIKKLGAIEIGIAPRFGRSERILQKQVERIVEAKAPEWRGKLQWRGPTAITVRTAGATVDAHSILIVAKAHLQAALKRDHGSIEISPVEGVRPIMLPQGVEMRPRPIIETVSRRTPVWIDFYVDEHVYSSLPVWFAVKAWKDVPVARSDLPAGAELRSEDFAVEKRDIALSPKILGYITDGSGLRLRTAISRGSPVPVAAVEASHAINRNDQIAVRITTGNIVIETTGIAEASGRIGELIKVKNHSSSKVFLAKVLKPGVVTMNMR